MVVPESAIASHSRCHRNLGEILEMEKQGNGALALPGHRDLQPKHSADTQLNYF